MRSRFRPFLGWELRAGGGFRGTGTSRRWEAGPPALAWIERTNLRTNANHLSTGGSAAIGMPRFPAGPKLTVDALWISRGRILLVRRGRDPFRGRWALPGGFVEAGETTESAVERELREETGLSARPVGIVGVYSEPGRDPRGPAVTIAYRMRGAAGSPQGGDDAEMARWIPVDRLPPLAFDHDRIVLDGIRPRKGRA